MTFRAIPNPQERDMFGRYCSDMLPFSQTKKKKQQLLFDKIVGVVVMK